MSVNTQKFLQQNGRPMFADQASVIAVPFFDSPVGKEIYSLLRVINGFTLFDRSIVFFPTNMPDLSFSLENWNDESEWKIQYKNLNQITFFGEDLFGNQFGTDGFAVFYFDAETGLCEPFANSLTAWIENVVLDVDFVSGRPVLMGWEEVNGPLAIEDRLIAKVPFIFGGAFCVDNLYAIERKKGMLIRANIARQVSNLPDGTRIVIKTDV